MTDIYADARIVAQRHREEGAAEERAKIVAWLRKEAIMSTDTVRRRINKALDQIEADGQRIAELEADRRALVSVLEQWLETARENLDTEVAGRTFEILERMK